MYLILDVLLEIFSDIVKKILNGNFMELNHHMSLLKLPENIAIKITPETYSGVAVVVIAKVDSVRSVRDPSRMPATTPTINALGTITSITQNMSFAVSDKRVAMMELTSSLKTVE